MIKNHNKSVIAFSIKNKVGAFLAALTVLTGAVSMPVSALGVVPSEALSFGQEVEVDVKTVPTIAYPVPKAIGISQSFYALHPGLDIRAPRGSDVLAIEPGLVTKVANEKYGYGRRVEITHEDGKVSLYAHLDKIEVYEGDLVTAETKIGEIGLTGRTTGPHLHLEVHLDGRALNPLTELSNR